MDREHGSWIKIFKDGSKELGSDFAIQENKASWTKGRLDDISEVLISNGIRCFSLSVPNTNWFQFDRYLTSVAIGNNNNSIRTHRIIQAEIKEDHVGLYFTGFLKSSYLSWAIVDKSGKEKYDVNQEIKSSDVGKWITIGLQRTGPIIFKFSSKGKL